ncbi:MAG: tail fiber protein [Candidatus Saccharimonadales bacterium]
MIHNRQKAFTIVELIVVISVIAVLVAISVVSYNGWQSGVRKAAVKSDLNAASATLENTRNLAGSGGYPTSNPTFTSSDNVTVVFTMLQVDQYCIDGQSIQDVSIQYYIYSKVKNSGPQEGTCATRTDLTPPLAPASVTIASATGTTAIVNWPSVAGAASYIAQCASDPVFIYGDRQSTVTNNSGTVSATINDLTPSTSFYCRVKSINAKGTSTWSGINNANTDSSYGSLVVGTSIDGYWTTPPQGFLMEDGLAVSRTTYAALFAVIGTTYGVGDNSTTFNLPDSRGRTAVNKNSTDVEFATVGQLSGSKAEQITIAQLPSHTHIQNPHNHNSGKPNLYVTTGPGINVDTANGSAFGFKYNVTTPSPSTVAVNQTTGGDQTHNNIQPSIVKLSAIKFSLPDIGATTLPEGSSINGYWSTAPTGYLLEDGAAISRTTYSALYAAIGTTYGVGDGSTTFNVPNSKGRAGVNISSADTEFDTMGEKTGSKREQLSVAQIPSHTHIQNSHNHNGGAPNPYVTDGSLGGVAVTSAAAAYYGFRLQAAPNTTATNQNTGGDQDHNNIQPSITKLSAIKYTTTSGASGSAVPTGTSLSGYWPTTIPTGYLSEDGSAISRVIYADLYRAIGTTYGVGDGSSTFNIPDSRGRVGVNRNSVDTQFDTMGEKYGEKSHVLTIAEMASHTHIQNTHDHNSGGITYISDGSFGGSAATSANGTAYGFTLIAQPSVTATNQNTGGGLSHNEIQPSIVKRFIIKY